MELGGITRVFKDRKGDIIGEYRKSAVMILLCEEEGRVHIVFEVRSYNLRHQPGDICLPGGRIEEEETSLEAAKRETAEELSLAQEDFEVIGEMDYFISPYGNIIYPFVAVLKNKDLKPNMEEVDHIFKVPVDFLLDSEPLCYEMKIGPELSEDFPYHLIRGGKEYKFSRGKVNQYFYKYEDHVIWGFTARIIKSFIDILKEQRNSPEYH